MTTYYKILGTGHKAIHGGSFTYNPNHWTPRVEARLCESGYHVCESHQLMDWLYADHDRQLPFEIWECEVDGMTASYDKSVCESIKLTRLVGTLDDIDLRWLATEFAVSCLQNTDDDRVSDCVHVSRSWCFGDATDDDKQAACSAADSAARSAADSAARSAAYSAAGAAAESAAWSAACSAADAAAWQTAWSAARSAARSAADSAAELAAYSAARSAAYSAAGKTVLDYLGGE